MKQKVSLPNWIVRLVMIFALMSSWSPAAFAADDKPLTLFLAGAYPFPLGVTSQWVGGEYGILGGFGYKESTWPVGLQFEGMTYRFGFNDRAESFAQSEGYMQMTAGTANVTWMPKKFEESNIKPRLITGIGVYNRVIRTTQQKPYAGACFDPWWGYYPCTGVGTAITNSQSQTKFGFNVGGSLGYELSGGSEVFVELRYHQVFTSHEITQFMPINFGFRW